MKSDYTGQRRSRCLMMGVGQRMIAHLLGHRHVGTTDRYTHVAVETTAPLVEKRWGAWKGEE